MSTYCTTVRRQVEPEPIKGTAQQRCPACGLKFDPRPPTDGQRHQH